MLRDFSKESFDVIIQAGQSNSAGCAYGNTDNPYEQNNEVYYLNADLSISVAAERVVRNGIQGNLALPFVREYMNAGMLEEGRKILIVRAAIGGTGFLDNRWGMEDDLYLHMMEMTKTALELNPENRLVALLWHQGETDASMNGTYEGHYKNFSTLVKSVKDEFNVPDLPFIAADLVHQWADAIPELCTPIVNAMRAVCKDITGGGFVETDGLLSNMQENSFHPLGCEEDSIHFSRRAIYELGERYFKCFAEIVKK